MKTTVRKVGMGVFRIEDGHGVQRFRSLADAIAEPPRDPDAEVRGPGGVLAKSTPDDEPCGWVVTALGRVRIESEIRGAA
jgi:hypothetical protein